MTTIKSVCSCWCCLQEFTSTLSIIFYSFSGYINDRIIVLTINIGSKEFKCTSSKLNAKYCDWYRFVCSQWCIQRQFIWYSAQCTLVGLWNVRCSHLVTVWASHLFCHTSTFTPEWETLFQECSCYRTPFSCPCSW